MTCVHWMPTCNLQKAGFACQKCQNYCQTLKENYKCTSVPQTVLDEYFSWAYVMDKIIIYMKQLKRINVAFRSSLPPVCSVKLWEMTVKMTWNGNCPRKNMVIKLMLQTITNVISLTLSLLSFFFTEGGRTWNNLELLKENRSAQVSK